MGNLFARRKLKRRGQSRGWNKRPQKLELTNTKRKKDGVFKRRVKKIFSKIQIVALIIVLIGIFLGSIVFFSFFTTQNIRVSRTDFRIDGEDIAEYAQQAYIGKNIFLLRKVSIQSELKKAFPEIATVEIERELPKTLRLIISTEPVAFRWSCERVKKSISETGDIIQTTESIAFYVNRDGRITLPNPDEQEAFLIYEKAPCPNEIDRRQQIMSTRTVDEIFAAKTLLAEVLQEPIDRAGYFRDAKEIHLISASNIAFWIDFSTPATEQIEKFRIALTLEPKLKSELDHVDLRVPEKIFYAPK